jgi:hypothetical protein
MHTFPARKRMSTPVWLSCGTNAAAKQVIAHRSIEPQRDGRRPLCKHSQASEYPGISARQTMEKFKYLSPPRLVEFTDNP